MLNGQIDPAPRVAYDLMGRREITLTIDEYDHARATQALPPAGRTPTPAPAAEAGRRVYTAMNDTALAVTFDEAGAMFTLDFGNATARLNLCEARDLAVVLNGTLDGWRADVHLPGDKRRGAG